MIEATLPVIAALGAAAFLVGLSKGGIGGGLGPLVTVLVAVVTSPSQAIGVLLPILMVGDVSALWVHRGGWDRSIILALLPGAVVGVVVASVFLGAVDDRAIELFLVVLSLLFVAYRLVAARVTDSPVRVGRGLAVGAGTVSGITSTVAHAGGPPVAVYLLAARITPVTYVATTAAFFFVVNWLKVPGYAAAGLLDVSMLRMLPLAVLIVPGTMAGRWLVDRVDDVVFERIVLALLVIGAVYLLVG